VAVGYLDAATYTVSYQTKIVWSGILSVILLGRRLGPHKWMGIALLAVGVAIVQIAGQEAPVAHSGEAPSSSSVAAASARFIGLSAVILAAMISALAGVYFEMILKGKAAVETCSSSSNGSHQARKWAFGLATYSSPFTPSSSATSSSRPRNYYLEAAPSWCRVVAMLP
jgi:drug/metabolite transporter (DMT)-like permease